jgi:hypothetical protein
MVCGASSASYFAPFVFGFGPAYVLVETTIHQKSPNKSPGMHMIFQARMYSIQTTNTQNELPSGNLT